MAKRTMRRILAVSIVFAAGACEANLYCHAHAVLPDGVFATGPRIALVRQILSG